MVKAKLDKMSLLRTGYPVRKRLVFWATEGRRPNELERPVGRRLWMRLAVQGGYPARPSLRSARKPFTAGADATHGMFGPLGRWS